jgi:hypothetical protein
MSGFWMVESCGRLAASVDFKSGNYQDRRVVRPWPLLDSLRTDGLQPGVNPIASWSHLQIVAVGDASKTRGILAKYGTVEVYDAEGKPIGGGQ